MGLFDKLKAAFTRTTSTLSQEIRRIVTRSPKLTAENLEELEAALLKADLGLATTQQILAAARTAFETQGRAGIDFIEIAAREVERNLAGLDPSLGRQPSGLTIVSVVGVNGTGKTPPVPSSRIGRSCRANPRSSPPATPSAPQRSNS
ncbi:MAG: signal recognition particle receptor subunit alpha [Verrucomicrobiota bacterium]